jgi:hypothetical protein
MKTPIGTEISVRRRVRDGWYVYTCSQLPGLYVASKDDRLAYSDLPDAIQKLIKLDTNAEVKAAHKVDYDLFMRQIQLQERARSSVKEMLDELMDDDSIPFLIEAQNDDKHVA